ncbi:methylated-DNA--[protein]-cysteine S-methyltransferase [Gordonia shandongensis]|uniref:methylated-DNA--[protein]-cysteine S-methyltransferase n=1 Tax=Gordonia shandongensis TaxID=376351 RepID=UPI000422E649|nr:methylated-DNA--[protein]-cysteine S-methyltransferase [Gordonia shandongensis]
MTIRDDVGELRARLAVRAEAAGLLEVAYRTIDTPVGRVLLAATDRGLVRVAFERQGFDATLDRLADALGPRVLEAPGRLDAAAREIDEFFAGRRTGFDVPLDFALSTGFRLDVQRSLTTIGYGRTRSYREVAQAVGNPGAVRAVGTACATNPLPLVVPCHRVTRADGSPGRYAGGEEAKVMLLALEATGVANR